MQRTISPCQPGYRYEGLSAIRNTILPMFPPGPTRSPKAARSADQRTKTDAKICRFAVALQAIDNKIKNSVLTSRTARQDCSAHPGDPRLLRFPGSLQPRHFQIGLLTSKFFELDGSDDLVQRLFRQYPHFGFDGVPPLRRRRPC